MPQDNKFTIKIESILGGISPAQFYAAEDQYGNAAGIAPDWPATATNESTDKAVKPAGFLRPTVLVNGAGSTLSSYLKWLVFTPKRNRLYSYGSNGSVYVSPSAQPGVVTYLDDLTDGGTSSGNGAAYYDNYVYFARDTTIARFGPLDGVASFTDDYWVTTLGKTALVNTDYPRLGNQSVLTPNHVMHRHTDGKLYIADVVGNQATIHYISTTKTAVEGDTDNGSTYNKLQYGYGLWPTDIKSYGDSLAIALTESTTSTNDYHRGSVLIIWDTVSQRPNIIIQNEFPDQIISALKNINGVIYIFSGPTDLSAGCRITRYIGGNTIEEVAYIPGTSPPLPDAVDGWMSQLFMGGDMEFLDENLGGISNRAGVVFSQGESANLISSGRHVPFRTSSAGSSPQVTAVKLLTNVKLSKYQLLAAWLDNSGQGLDSFDSSSYAAGTSQFWFSQIYRIGQRFKLTKLSFNTTKVLTANQSVTATLYTDFTETAWWEDQTKFTVDSTSYNGKRKIDLRPIGLEGTHNFALGFTWGGSTPLTIALPIIIEGELLPDD